MDPRARDDKRIVRVIAVIVLLQAALWGFAIFVVVKLLQHWGVL